MIYSNFSIPLEAFILFFKKLGKLPLGSKHDIITTLQEFSLN